jgi:hypothetical protein
MKRKDLGLECLWIFAVTFVIVLLEVFASRWELLFPGALFACFYVVVSHGRFAGLIAGALAVTAVEILLVREMTLLPLIPFEVLGAYHWAREGERHDLIVQVIPCGLLALIHGAAYRIGDPLATGMAQTPVLAEIAKVLAVHTLIAAVLLPVILFFCDHAAEHLDLPRFRRAKRTT